MCVLPFSIYKEEWMLPFLPEILLQVLQEKDTPMIICVHQRGGVKGITHFDVHDTKQSLISRIRRLINYHHRKQRFQLQPMYYYTRILQL